jgi:cyanobactin maturation PatA/PatG family protease
MDSNPYDDKQGPNPGDPDQLLAYLGGHPWDASALTWTLVLDGTPMYAIDATFHPYGHVVYERLREYLHGQSQGSIERVSIPGVIAGSKTLMSGQKVPIISPEPRGMYAWSTEVLVKALLNPEGKASPDPPGTAEDIASFLDRIYYEVRNLGISPQERAINHAATNAFQLRYVYRSAIERKMKLDAIGVEKSPFCRSGSDCWDVKLSFFNPQKRLEEARLVYRFTVDVSDIVPVTVGKVRHWHVY